MVQPGPPSWSSASVALQERATALWVALAIAGALVYVVVALSGLGGPAGQAAALMLPLGVSSWRLGLRRASVVVVAATPLSIAFGDLLALGPLQWLAPCHAVAAAACLGLARLHDARVATGEAREGALRAHRRLLRRREQSDAVLRALPDRVFRVRAEGRLEGIGALRAQTRDETALATLLPNEARARIAEAAQRMRVAARLPERLYVAQSRDPMREFEVRLMRVDDDVIGILRDVTERRRLERELVSARETALDAARLKTKFLANMSHEIRTPMNGVIGMTNLLRETPLTREQSEYVEIIHKSGNALLEIIDEVLDFAKIEAGKMELDEVEFDPRATAYESVDAVAGQAFAKDLELGTIVHDDVPALCLGDPTRLRQVLAILLSNAVRFTDRGRVRVEVQSEPPVGGLQALRFSVQDTGQGLGPKPRQDLFHPQVSGPDAEHGRGRVAGLGLAICRQLVELMGGEIGVDSDEGTTFRFSVALGVVDAELAEPESAALRESRVLLVQHAPGGRLLAEVLGTAGIETLVSSCDEAVVRLQCAERDGHAFHAVIFDLPGDPESVMAAAQAIRREPCCSELPLLAVDEPETNSSVTRDALRQGVGRLLRWPVRRDEVLGALRAALERHPREDGASEAESLRQSQSEPPLPGARALVVVEGGVEQRLLLSALEQLGCVGEVASDVAAASAAVSRTGFDAVLLDLGLAAQDDGALMEHLRAQCRDAPIVAVAGRDDGGLRDRCLAAGFADLVPMPLAVADLRAVLERASASATASRDGATDPRRAAEFDVPAGDALDRTVLQKLEALGDGDPSFLREIFQIFLDQTPRNLAAIEAALSVGDPDAVGKTAHTMKSGADHLGALRMAALCRLVERHARAVEPGEGLLRAVESLHAEFERVQAALRVELEGVGA